MNVGNSATKENITAFCMPGVRTCQVKGSGFTHSKWLRPLCTGQALYPQDGELAASLCSSSRSSHLEEEELDALTAWGLQPCKV